VHQVGYLQRLYQDARSTEHKTYRLHVLIVSKSWSLNLLEHSGPVEACNGIALHLHVS